MASNDRFLILPGGRVRLPVQDTTTLNYSGLENCTVGLGPLGGKSQGKDGLLVHAGLALADGGCWGCSGCARGRAWRSFKALTGGKKADRERWLEGFEQAVELGRACPRTRMITVCDRKGDIFSLLRRQAAQADPAGLLLSSDGEATAQDTLRTVARYERRWLIDEYFRCSSAARSCWTGGCARRRASRTAWRASGPRHRSASRSRRWKSRC